MVWKTALLMHMQARVGTAAASLELYVAIEYESNASVRRSANPQVCLPACCSVEEKVEATVEGPLHSKRTSVAIGVYSPVVQRDGATNHEQRPLQL